MNDPKIIKNTAHVDFNDNIIDNVRFVKLNTLPAVRDRLTPKLYVDDAMSNSVGKATFLRLVSDEQLKLGEEDLTILNCKLTSTIPKKLILTTV